MINQTSTILTQIRIVLVEPTHPGNLGAVARAMKTMGLQQLALVNPRKLPDSEALAFAAGADDVLEHASFFTTFPESIADCRLVIGASARLRSIAWPVLNPSSCAEKLLEAAASGTVALVLGRESSGLSNQELAHCHALVQIPTNPDFSSLNLAAAAQVLTYEIYRAWMRKNQQARVNLSRELATTTELEGFYAHLAETLQNLGYQFINQTRTSKLMRRLRRLFYRAQLDSMEINLLRGILRALNNRAK